MRNTPSDQYQKGSRSGRVVSQTLGCRLNTYESEVMKAHARAQGLSDCVIINTCAVTNEAERQSRQAVRKAVRENPEAKVIVAGCSAQLHPDDYANISGVDRVLGNHEKMQPESFAPATDARVQVNNIFDVSETASHLIQGFDAHVRSFIQIQNGCNHRCTFCSIPFSRGNNRSVPMAEVIAQIQHLVAHDIKEVVLTGVDITDYGHGLAGVPKLGDLVHSILTEVPELPRLRLSSVDPVEVDEKLLALLCDEPRLMPHVHISLQSGHDMILKRMKRRHLCRDVAEFCATLRAKRPHMSFGGDIIAGFPTETEDMFNHTCAFLQEVGINFLHVFPFSPRHGTPAARMPQLPRAVVRERARELRKLGADLREAFYRSLVGRREKVLLETPERGHSETFADVRLNPGLNDEAAHRVVGSIQAVEFTHVSDTGHLMADVYVA